MHRAVAVVCTLGSVTAHAQPAPPAAQPVPDVEVANGRVEVDHAPAIPSDLLFDPGETQIKAAGRPLLDAVARALAKDATTTVKITAFTDDTAPDNDRSGGYNTKLSQARADAVAAYLGKKGVAARRLIARGLGRDKPALDGTSDDARRANRRLELAVVGEVRAPDAGDLAGYTRNLKGKGALIATLTTTQGTLHCELLDDKAPATVANFIGLATGQKPWTDPRTQKTVRGKPFFDGLVFHRVIPKFIVQAGDPLANGTGGPGYAFDDELGAGLLHQPGTMAMANAGPGTNGSQFFIDEAANKALDGHYSIFGQCKELDVLAKISGVPRGANDKPTEPIMINKVTIARGTL